MWFLYKFDDGKDSCKSDNQNISIKLSKSFIGKEFEVIAFTIEEAVKQLP